MKLPNGSTDINELREYMQGKNVRWVDLFKRNLVPDELIIEFQDRILAGDSTSRIMALIASYENAGKTFGKDLIELFLSQPNMTYMAMHFTKVIDFDVVFESTPLEFWNKVSVHMHELIKIVDNVPLKIINHYLEQAREYWMPSHTITLVDILNKRKVLPEVKERIIEYVRANEIPAACQKVDSYKYFSEIFTFAEFVQVVNNIRILDFIELRGSFLSEPYDDVCAELEELFSKEVQDIVVEKLLQAIADGVIQKTRLSDWKLTRKLIKGHEKFDEIYNALTSEIEQLTDGEIDWQNVAAKYEDKKIHDEILEKLLILDAPEWFLERYATKMMQFILRNQNSQGSNFIHRFPCGFEHFQYE